MNLINIHSAFGKNAREEKLLPIFSYVLMDSGV